MRCPKCENTTLKLGKIESKQLDLDRCPTCKGMWFDQGELAALLTKAVTKDFVIPEHAYQTADLMCPRCEVALFEFCYPKSLVLVDGCKTCQGVWLDNKEWQVIKQARDESKNINCPKCQTRQKPAESCAHCGIVMKKFKKLEAGHRDFSNRVKIEQSYADDIPGIKGSLLRMIDGAIKSLTKTLF